ncbi:MAG: FHA domain-containing protein [Chloroflexota bacterium]
MRKLTTLFLGATLVISATFPASAQDAPAARLSVSSVQTGSFPQVSLAFEAYTPEGAFIAGLAPDQVIVLEDGQPRPVSSLEEQTRPVQWVVAVNPGLPLAFEDANGVSRYERVRQTLQDWAVTHPASLDDDMSLASANGAVFSHGPVADWVAAFLGMDLDAANTLPTLQTLSFALDLAQDAPPQPDMRRAVLFVTPHMEQDQLGSLDSLLARALQSDTSVTVWMVDSSAYFAHSSAATFQNLAVQTGGNFYPFDGGGALPNPEEFLDKLRHVYALTYTSGLNTPGDHTLTLQITAGEIRAESPPQAFTLDIQPPNPVLVSPPARITRQTPEDDKYNLEAMTPAAQPLEMLVEFPDGYERRIARTALYVDGQLAAENTAEPFETFTWDLSAYAESGEHTLQVEAEDELGLSRISMGVPVQVTVIQPPDGLRAFLDQYSQYLAVGAAVLAGSVLLLILTSSRRRGLALARRRNERALYNDPVTQPVALQQDGGRKQPGRLPWSRRPKLADAPAYLVRLGPDLEPATGNPIPLNVRELTLGTDPVQSLHVLDHPSIAPLHARIRQNDEGDFIISDQDTVAGTWVNYEPITREGYRLQHGDVIHFGQLVYRFNLRKAPPKAEPRITYLNRDG